MNYETIITENTKGRTCFSSRDEDTLRAAADTLGITAGELRQMGRRRGLDMARRRLEELAGLLDYLAQQRRILEAFQQSMAATGRRRAA